MKAIEIVKLLGLIELPEEGGFFKRTYRSKTLIKSGNRENSAGDGIFYLITPDQFSALHKLKCDEMWHFYAGDTVEMIQLKSDKLTKIILGNADFRSQTPQTLVEANVWQGARLAPGGQWALLGTNAFPAYNQEDFELATMAVASQAPEDFRELISQYVR